MDKYRLPRTFNRNALELSLGLAASSSDARVIESVQSRLNRFTVPGSFFFFLSFFTLSQLFPLLFSLATDGSVNINAETTRQRCQLGGN